MSASTDTEAPTLTPVDTTESRTVALGAARAAEDKKATDITILDVGELIGITDYFVIASTGNPRQLDTVVEEVQRALKQDGRAPLRREGVAAAGWLVLDYGDVMVHIFTSDQRAYYDLERLWGDAPRLELAAPGRSSAQRSGSRGVGRGVGSASTSSPDPRRLLRHELEGALVQRQHVQLVVRTLSE